MSIRIALAGNPNSGKTTLFNALTGSNQYVGNWPGVTVEKKEGRLKGRDDVTVTDLPGIYSLSPYTPEEIVARKYLIDESPDAILNIVDGTNLERNLYLTTQLTELGIPVVVAINMMDVVRRRGDKINVEGLSRIIGCPVVEISALKLTGISEAADAAIKAAAGGVMKPVHTFSGTLEHALAHIEEAAVHHFPPEKQRWYAIKIFERDTRVIERLNVDKQVMEHIENDITEVERAFDDDAESIITNERYIYVGNMLRGIYRKQNAGKLSASDKIDKIVTNRFAALPIFALIMFIVYFLSVATVGAWMTDFANEKLFGDGFYLFGNENIWIPGVGELIRSGLEAINCASGLISLIVDGIVGGVGAVLGFVPQMLVLFLLLGFLESCGYMSRIAFVMDRIFRKFGLSGKSFIPLLVGTGCSVPGIMASRTIENERDRRMTVITTSFIPCGAKIPVISFVAASLFGNSALIAVSAYFIGVAAIVLSGLILKKTSLFRGDPSPFVMELPEYHMPTAASLLRSTWDRGWSFIKKAGTVILLSAVVIWVGSTVGFTDGALSWSVEMPIESSIIGIIGSTLCWLFVPLGFGNVKATVATLMGLIAKEEIVAVFGVLDFAGFGKLSGFSFLIFNLLCAPCVAAMGAIRREMNSPKWTAFAIAYQCVFAYCTSLCIYQIGMLMGGNFGFHILGGAVALLIIAGVVFMLRRSDKIPQKIDTGRSK